MQELLRDLKYTLRRLAAAPGFTLATVLTLALGIGANTAIFTIVNGVLLKPLPFPEPDRLIGVWQTASGLNIKDLNPSLADYVTYREQSRTFADVALYNGRSATVTEFPDPERVEGLSATFRLLSTIGVRPILGRDFAEKDNEEGSPEVVLISHGYWQRRFGGDPKAIGRRLMADGKAREIIGILPQDFWFMDQKHDIVFPIRYARSEVRLGGYNSQGVARLRPGVTLDQANADIARMIRIEFENIPPPKGLSTKMFDDARMGPNARLLMNDLLGDIGKSLWVVMATIGIVLLIACANVANLLLVRTEGRAQELAVRAALGAGRGRIARELLLESVVLALLGGLIGMGFAWAVTSLVLQLSPARLPRAGQISIDLESLLFTLALSLAAGLVFGAIPVLRQAGVRLAEALRSGGRTASSGRDRNAARNSLTVAQVALALVLLVGSGLMIRTFLAMRRVNPGFTGSEGLQTMRISIPRSKDLKDPELLRVHDGLLGRLARIPGVTAVGATDGLPMTGASSNDPIYVRDRTYAPDEIPPLRRYVRVTPGAFSALGATVVAGREYSWTDIHENRDVIIVSENFAREFWGSPQAAIGKQIRSLPMGANPWKEIIGVAADIRHDGVEKKAPSVIYWPMRPSYSMAYLVRSPRAGAESFAAELRQAVWAGNGGAPISEMRTMKEIYDRSMARTAFTLTLLGASGIMALALALVGIYAVISYGVTQRRREIGIRLALGAPQSTVKALFVRRGLLWTGVGAAAGLVGAAVLSRLMTAILFEVSPFDPVTYVAVALGLLSAAAAASYLPARRVARVDPIEVLRAD
ncbi:MAG: ABC transporter permease [Bryobacteraceae bacterium]